MESICRKVPFPCKYRYGGCTVKKVNIEVHENQCKHNSARRCPLAQYPCSWRGNFADMQNHIEYNHNHLFMRNFRDPFTISSDLLLHPMLPNVNEWFFKKYGKLFQIIVKNEGNKTPMARIMVNFIGSEENAIKYGYEIEIANANKSKLMTITDNCEPMESEIKVSDNSKGFTISYPKLMQYAPSPRAAIYIRRE